MFFIKNAGTECRNKEALDIYLDGMEELIRTIAYAYPEESEYIIYIDKGPASQLGCVLDEKICAILKSDKTPTIEIKRVDSQNAEEIQEADLIARSYSRGISGKIPARRRKYRHISDTH